MNASNEIAIYMGCAAGLTTMGALCFFVWSASRVYPKSVRDRKTSA